jgi:hypothetical protein
MLGFPWAKFKSIGFRRISGLRCDSRPQNFGAVVGYDERDGIITLGEWPCYAFDGLAR